MRQTVAIPSQRLSEPLGDHLVDGSRDRRFVVLTTLARYLHACATGLAQLIEQAPAQPSCRFREGGSRFAAAWNLGEGATR